MSNSRFSIAIHTTCLLALSGDEQPLTSEYIAASANTNPVVIRRILALLRRAKLVCSIPGTNGGWFLSKPKEKLMLTEILAALNPEPVFSLHSRPPNPHCAVGKNIQRSLKAVFRKTNDAMTESITGISIAEVLKETLKQK